jgi:hypothetical protein
VSLYFITPAWGRFELTAVCLAQRRQVIDYLATCGLEAHQVVIADDANLDTAQALGFDTVERPNNGPDGKVWLGRKFNDGYQYAAEHGAQWFAAIGSDSWIDPDYFLPLPDKRRTRTSSLYCPVTFDRLAELSIPDEGAGPHVYSRYQLGRAGFRPAEDSRPRSIDNSTIRGIRGAMRWECHNLHPLQYIGFRSTPMISPYSVLVEAARERPGWSVRERSNPWKLLAQHYPADLVERARLALAPAAVAA